MAERRKPNKTELLAAALLELDRFRSATFGRVLEYEDAKHMSNEEIIAHWVADHYPAPFAHRDALATSEIPYIHHATNLTMRPHEEHDRKTAKEDTPKIAKGKRIRKKLRVGADPVIAAIAEEVKGVYDEVQRWKRPKRKIPSRPFAQGKRSFPVLRRRKPRRAP